MNISNLLKFSNKNPGSRQAEKDTESDSSPSGCNERNSLPDYGCAYFNHLVAEYKTILQGTAVSAEQAAARTRAEEVLNKAFLSWGDLYILENAILQLQPIASLRQRASGLRVKYRDVANDADYAEYLKAAPDPKAAGEADLRADLEHVLGEFHWIYSFTSVLEKERNRILDWVRNLTVAFIVILVGLAGLEYYLGSKSTASSGNSPLLATTQSSGVANSPLPATAPILPLVMLMGVIGGFISLQQRIQSVPTKGDPVVSILQLSNSRSSVYLAPISGAVFASLLYLIFIATLIEGVMFPKIYTPRKPLSEIVVRQGPVLPTAGPTSSTGGLPAGAATGTTMSGRTANTGITGSSGSTGVTGASPNIGTSVGITGAELVSPNPPNIEVTTSAPDKTGRTPSDSGISFLDFVRDTGPETGVDFAKLLVWAFIAGFAERFVPDTLDRLVAKAQNDGGNPKKP